MFCQLSEPLDYITMLDCKDTDCMYYNMVGAGSNRVGYFSRVGVYIKRS